MASDKITQISATLNQMCEENINIKFDLKSLQIEDSGEKREYNLIKSIQMDADLICAEIDNECKKRNGEELPPDEVLSILVDEMCSTSTEDSEVQDKFSLGEHENSKCQIEMSGKNISPLCPDYNRGDLLFQIRKLADEYQHFKENEVAHCNDKNKNACNETSNNHIEFHLVTNSVAKPVDDNILIWLTQLRNIMFQSFYFTNEISQERLTRNKISRYVFDPKNRSLLVLQNGDVIGGICFRMYSTCRKPFSEIAFVAVPDQEDLDDQDSWIILGTVMMNHLKDYNIKRKIYNLLAFVPKEAITYFEMQGFTRGRTLPTSAYKGDIYVHKEDILMEFQLDKRISYTGLSEAIAKQKWILRRLIERNIRISFANTLEDKSNSDMQV